MKIALFSDHASPFTVAGGIGTGRPNDDVAHVARQLQRAGYQVDARRRNRERGGTTRLPEDGAGLLGTAVESVGSMLRS